MYKTLAEATEAKIQEHISDVKFWMEYGLSKEDAIAKVRDRSLFKQPIWGRIANEIN